MNEAPFSSKIYEQSAPWVVLATSVLITSCATGGFMPIDLLKAPLGGKGQIQNQDGKRYAQITVVKWFPIMEAILELEGGLVYTKVRDFPGPKHVQAAGDNHTTAVLDLTGYAPAANCQSFSLMYYPWYRFLTEPIAFDAAGRVAAYIGDSVRFVLARSGALPLVETSSETCTVSAGNVRIVAEGMNELRSLRILEGDAETRFDLAARTIVIDGRMFPAAHTAGCEMLKTNDRLINMTVTQDGHRLTLAHTEGANRV